MASKRNESSEEVYERVHELLMTRGIVAAVESLIAVAEDPKAPAPARATAGTSLLRAAGMFAAGKAGGKQKLPSEMTPEELTNTLAKLRSDLERSERAGHDDEQNDGIFA
ncbi:hypothetical protein [Mesorhizobium sp. 10J20-29]